MAELQEVVSREARVDSAGPNDHPASLDNAGPEWVQGLTEQLAAALSKHGYLLAAALAAIYLLWPTYGPRIKDYFFPAQPVAVASRVTAGDAAAARQDCYAEERRAAILRQQERLEAETAQKMAEQKELEEAMRERRLAALDEEARKFGMQTERGQTLGGTDQPGGQHPSASRPVSRVSARPAAASRSGYNPMDGIGGVGGFRSTRNAGRG
mmetsp:Transcript_34283/g.87672  ORF Transcript_34283/g.87672 Transcript_34283/m.87672 type:complete len:211 (+) Transcript_34283:146-778(+)